MQYGSTETVTPDLVSSAIRIFSSGTELGNRYEIRKVLGIGGSGVVYAAFDRELGREIALKVLRSDRTTDHSLKRFRREIGVARDAHSPHLIRIFDIAQTNESLYLTMELVEGASLQRRIAEGPIAVDDAVDIFRQILVALDTLHCLGIVHRDVKPGNVLLADEGVVKLADFGLARYLEQDTRTETNAVLGTLEYLSPEQALGKDLDARADLYAAGIALYEMLTGDVPFREQSSLGTIIAHLHRPVPNVRHERPDVPRWLAAILARLVEKDREHRYASAAAALRDLESHRGPPLRWRVRPALSALFVVLLVAVTAWRLVEHRRSRFSTLTANGFYGFRAVDRAGRTLWTEPTLQLGTEAVVFRPEPEKAPLVAIVHPSNPSDRSSTPLELRDAQTGRVVEKTTLPSGASTFFRFSNTYAAAAARAVDIDHDGAEELVVTYCHNPYYPSYSVLYDRARGRSGVILLASGHHRILDVIDIDRDGRDELIFSGVSNRLGFHFGMAAVRVAVLRNSFDVAATPDLSNQPSSQRALVWYALLGRSGYDHATDAVVNHERRTIAVLFGDGRREEIGVNGLPADLSSQLAEQRTASRVASYTALRDAIRQSEAGYAADSLVLIERAIAEADRTADPPLQLWTRRVSSKVLIRAGRSREAQTRTREVMQQMESPSDACWDAAVTFHLQGNLDLAYQWYATGLRIIREPARGRMNYEFLEGLLFVDVERGRWRAAQETAEAFRAALSNQWVDVDYYADWLEWLRTGVFRRTMTLTQSNLDIFRYLELEQAWSTRSTPPAALLGRIDASTLSGAYAPLSLSLKAEIIEAGGDRAEAVALARTAYDDLVRMLRNDSAARAHLNFASARYARLLESAGHTDEARRVRDAVEPLLAPLGD
jgi:hypothetical protein